jgi:ABC-type ATPase involved in cell division/GNAT superfamily N-acetyltransferase
MPSIDLVTQSTIRKTPRVKQLEAMFDAPTEDVLRVQWHGEFPIEDTDWNVGLIVGPSGAGKSTIARHLFGDPIEYEWTAQSVIDDFPRGLTIEDIAQVCQSVGFNTIPAWMRPYRVLSTGEKFRVDIARRLLTDADPIVVDEFTSVVDRQVAQIGSHAVQKYIRKHGRRFVGVSCHYDIVDWLQPDWIFEPATMSFIGRSLQRRPPIEIEIRRVGYDWWRLFAPFHYLTNDLHKAARCFVLFANGHPASFGAMLHRPHPKVNDIMGLSRLVTLPDWQGLGLAMVLSDQLGAAYKAIGKRMHTYPAHPSLIRSFDHSANWRMEKKPGAYSGKSSKLSTMVNTFGGRPSAVFSYNGDAMDMSTAQRLISGV